MRDDTSPKSPAQLLTKPFDAGSLQVVGEFVIKPEPRTIFRTEPATAGDFLTWDGLVVVELFANRSKLGGMMQKVERLAQKARRLVTEHAGEAVISEGNGAIELEHCQQFAGRIEE
jgi:hypothetical protein